MIHNPAPSTAADDLLTRCCITAYEQRNINDCHNRPKAEWTVVQFDRQEMLADLRVLTKDRLIPWTRFHWYPARWGRVEVSDHPAFEAQMRQLLGLD